MKSSLFGYGISFLIAVGCYFLAREVSFTNQRLADHIKNDTLNTIVEVQDSPLIVEVRATCYNPVPMQGAGDGKTTSDLSHIDTVQLKTGKIHWVALSRDLLKRWGGPFDYGDTIFVFTNDTLFKRKWVVHDCIGPQAKRQIDFLMDVSVKLPDMPRTLLISKSLFFLPRYLKLQ